MSAMLVAGMLVFGWVFLCVLSDERQRCHTSNSNRPIVDDEPEELPIPVSSVGANRPLSRALGAAPKALDTAKN